jgi:hypothetical protein
MLPTAIPAGKNIWVQLRRAQSLEPMGFFFVAFLGAACFIITSVTLVEWYLMV